MKTKISAISLLIFIMLISVSCSGSSDQNTSSNNAIRTFADLHAALEDMGAIVSSGSQVDQEFFSVPGQILTVNGVDVQVFAYESAEGLESDAVHVASDGSSVGTSMPMWRDSPHFYKSGQILALYIGDAPVILELLDEAIGPQFAGQQPADSSAPSPDAADSALVDDGLELIADTAPYLFKELGFSLTVPMELYVIKTPIVDLDNSSELDAYLFYIQNYGYPNGPSSGDFQMYGHLQYELPPISWDKFADDMQNNSQNYEYVDFIEIGGLKGFSTQLSGQRNNFVYLFHVDNHVLTIAVSSANPENKALAEQILNTLELNEDGLSNASHVRLITEANDYFQILIPEDWMYEFKGTSGIRLSDFEAFSPDAEFVVDEGPGPSSKISYKSGVFMTLVVLNDTSANLPPNSGLISDEYEVSFNGVEGTEYIFIEPSTAAGELREVRVYFEGKSFLLRFGYLNSDYDEAIDRIISSLSLYE